MPIAINHFISSDIRYNCGCEFSQYSNYEMYLKCGILQYITLKLGSFCNECICNITFLLIRKFYIAIIHIITLTCIRLQGIKKLELIQ